MLSTEKVFNTYKRILDLEERRGRLRENYFSADVLRLSSELKTERKKLKNASKKDRDNLNLSVKQKKEEYESARAKEIEGICNKINNGDFSIELKEVNAKGKKGYTTDNVESMILSRALMLDLKRSYKHTPANRNEIIEEICALLNNPTPKVVIRADVHHFFESIPQSILIEQLMEDSYLSSKSLKYLKTFFYKYNELSNNLESKLGVPRGLSFSSYLAEIYMSAFDKKIKQTDGVYFYKRYVDDIIILADPFNHHKDHYLSVLEEELHKIGLSINKDHDKLSCDQYSYHLIEPMIMNYLGYQFRYFHGQLEVLMTDKKYQRYKESVRLIFEKYKKICSYTSRKKKTSSKKTDSTIQFMHRLSAITSNGHLNGRKNYVLVGIYYSNKYINCFEQLEELDEYILNCLKDRNLFCPSEKMFQYGSDSDYKKSVDAIKKKIIDTYSFSKGFSERRMYKWRDYASIISQISRIYYSKENDEQAIECLPF